MDILCRIARPLALSAWLCCLSGQLLAAEESNPLRFYQSTDQQSYLQATVNFDMAFFSQDNAWYGQDRTVIGAEVDTWWETLFRLGLEGRAVLANTQSIYGRIDVVQANTFGGYDAAGTNADLGDESSLRIDKAYLGWRSGNLFAGLGEDFLDISFGRQIYTAGTLFLFGSEGGAGFHRAAYYLGGRRSADFTAIAKFKTGKLTGDVFFFDNDSPFPVNTQATGLTLDYSLSPHARIGSSLATLNSESTSRDGMHIYDIRGSLAPFAAFSETPALHPLIIEGELAVEDRDDNQDTGLGWYLSARYQWQEIPWKPEFTYRYSSFDEDYDVLFYSATDWGSWFQGEITGEYDLFNMNQDIHMFRLKVKPLDCLKISLFYFDFNLHSPTAMGVRAEDYTNEWNLSVDWHVNDHLSLYWVGAYATPEAGAKQRFHDDEDWKAMMLWASVHF
ncbi:hypothetical protein JWJ90_18115 [Desulfobulbus rhabdoformis]|uniref:hypothetical protein n=1 Tax=Desulfobulbus rhabdoformis TaxID=34032 RepID=UPI001963C136|nr:hypothetical protein [Desulfobulbus rhabdoformis]MBM9616187.1 hypothetical protein [Desulfobulbus rhabdoformis]